MSEKWDVLTKTIPSKDSMRGRMLADEELPEEEFERQAHRIALEAHEDRLKLWETALERFDTEVAILRAAVEEAYDWIDTDSRQDWYPDDDLTDGAIRVILRLLAESLGKDAPRLLKERPEGQKLFGLHYSEMAERIAALEAELATYKKDCLRLDAELAGYKENREVVT
jgi:predicted RNase H-like nuclease (RuvC/YqgF family)